MNANDLLELLRATPFIPFRLYSTDGRTHDVRHPDQALVLRHRVVLPATAGEEPSERSEHWSLLHIVRAEELSAPSASSKN